jgi:hypothetical protein
VDWSAICLNAPLDPLATKRLSCATEREILAFNARLA